MLQRWKSIRASPPLCSFLGRILSGAAPLGNCHRRGISPLPLVYSSILPSHVRHYSVSYEEAYSRFNLSSRTNWGIHIVPENNVSVVERFGKYSEMLNAGIHMLIPFVDRIAYVHSLMEERIQTSNLSVTTKDNINILVDSVIYVKIVDPYLASYAVENPIYTATSVGLASLQRELGKIASDKTFSHIDTLSKKIVKVVDEAATDWGVQCTRFEIMKISPPPCVEWVLKVRTLAMLGAMARIFECLAALFDKEHLAKDIILPPRMEEGIKEMVEALHKGWTFKTQAAMSYIAENVEGVSIIYNPEDGEWRMVDHDLKHAS